MPTLKRIEKQAREILGATNVLANGPRDFALIGAISSRVCRTKKPFGVDLGAVYRQVDGRPLRASSLPDTLQAIRDFPVVVEGMIIGAAGVDFSQRKKWSSLGQKLFHVDENGQPKKKKVR